MNQPYAHSDHRYTFDNVAARTKSFRYAFVKKVLMYDSISEIEFEPMLPENGCQPNYFVAITDFLRKKLK